MLTVEHPRSLSIYRGQARHGIGEGPEKLIAHGEQYLAADGELRKDGELLDACRLWMTLDSEPADLEALGPELEGWSVFAACDRIVVCRMVPAGTYDRRPAYFAHARTWEDADLAGGFDPGALLGDGSAFERPWRDEDPGTRLSEPTPGMVRPEQIARERETAARLLAHLYQAVVRDYPLILAVPVREFTAGGPLHALVSFARAALPADLKPSCRIRIFTRYPEVFLRRLQAHLVAIPDELASETLSTFRNAVLLDRDGGLRAGAGVEAEFTAYASAVVKRATRIPDGLLAFSRRFAERRLGEDAPTMLDAAAVPLTYNLAYAFEEPEERLDDLLRNYLVGAANRLEGEVPWQRWITAEEWTSFPRRAVEDFLLLAPGELQPRSRRLQGAAERAAAERGWDLTDRLEAWWDAADDGKLDRLAELLALRPPLLAAAAAAELTSRLPTDRLRTVARPEAVLAAERDAGLLERRGGEVGDLAALARRVEVFRLLAAATEESGLGPGWLDALLAAADRDALAPLVEALLADPVELRRSKGVLARALSTLETFGALPGDLDFRLFPLVKELRSEEDFPLLLSLVELAVGGNPAGGGAWIKKLASALPGLTRSEHQRLALEVALDPGRRALTPELLVDERGDPSVPWLAGHLDLLLEHPVLLDRLGTLSLLRLASARSEPPAAVVRSLDQRMERDARSTTAALVRSGWWSAWRAHTSRAGEQLRRDALAWLGSPIWSERDHPEATREAWRQVLNDLGPDGLAGEELGRILRRGAGEPAPLPLIEPFEPEQLAELKRIARDLGALAEIAEAWPHRRWDPGTPTYRWCLQGSPLAAGGLPADALLWLIEPGRRPASPGPPELEHQTANLLLDRAGHRRPLAQQAKVQVLLRQLEHEPAIALESAVGSRLDSEPAFRSGLWRWLQRQRTARALERRVLDWLEQAVETDVAFERGPDGNEALARQLLDSGFPRSAEFLRPGVGSRVYREQLPERALRAMLEGRVDDPCWSELVLAVGGLRQGGDHPVDQLRQAFDAETGHRLEPGDPADREMAWVTFVTAANAQPQLWSGATDSEAGLPALLLAGRLLPRVPAGRLALRVVFQPGTASYAARDPFWWQQLLKAVEINARGDRQGAGPVVAAHALLAQWALEMREPRSRQLANALRSRLPTEQRSGGWEEASN